MRRDTWITAALMAAVVLIFMVSLVMAPRPSGAGGGAFAGSDTMVTDALQAGGAQPWYSPVFTPASSEIESGLFALQAALGAGVVGYALGNLRGRTRARQEMAAAPDVRDTSAGVQSSDA